MNKWLILKISNLAMASEITVHFGKEVTCQIKFGDLWSKEFKQCVRIIKTALKCGY